MARNKQKQTKKWENRGVDAVSNRAERERGGAQQSKQTKPETKNKEQRKNKHLNPTDAANRGERARFRQNRTKNIPRLRLGHLLVHAPGDAAVGVALALALGAGDVDAALALALRGEGDVPGGRRRAHAVARAAVEQVEQVEAAADELDVEGRSEAKKRETGCARAL